MVKLIIKNTKEIEDLQIRARFESLWTTNREYIDELFKNYEKELLLEVIVNKSGKTYKVSCSLNMLSKVVQQLEEDIDIMAASTRLFSKFKKEIKRQKELEKKDYLYKRKR